MAWRLAKSLQTLRDQVNHAYPNRNKASDGTIGDASHQTVPSDHNPNSQNVVCALDITHHPGYFDAHALADRLRVKRHPNLKYIISNSRIAGRFTGWYWRAYNGANPHDKHIHISVGEGSDGNSKPGTYDNITKWNIGEEMITNKNHLTVLFERFRARKPSASEIKKYLNKWSYAQGVHALDQGDEADRAKRALQLGEQAMTENWPKKLENYDRLVQQLRRHADALTNDIATMKAQADKLSERPTKKAFDELHHNLTVCKSGVEESMAEIKRLQNDLDAVQEEQELVKVNFLKQLFNAFINLFRRK